MLQSGWSAPVVRVLDWLSDRHGWQGFSVRADRDCWMVTVNCACLKDANALYDQALVSEQLRAMLRTDAHFRLNFLVSLEGNNGYSDTIG